MNSHPTPIQTNKQKKALLTPLFKMTNFRFFPHIVVGVENSGDVLSQVSIQHCLDVSSNIN